MFDLTLHNILHSNVINFAVLIALIGFIVNKIRIADMIEAKRKSVIITVTSAEEHNSVSKSNLQNAVGEIEKLPQALLEIEGHAKDNLSKLEEKLNTEAGKVISNIEKNVEKVIESEASKINRSLTSGVSAASIQLAESSINKQLVLNSELHNRFIGQAIDELENVNI